MSIIYKKRILVLIIAATLLVAPFLVQAINDVTINGIVNFNLLTADTAIPTTVLASAGGQVTLLDVQSNYIDITLDNTSTITFNTTAPSRFIRITWQSGSVNYTVAPVCPTTTVTLTGTGAQVVLRLEVYTTNICPPPPGGGHTYIFPTNYSVTINNNSAQTSSVAVTLNLSAQNATQVIVSNDPNFYGASWQSFTDPTNLPWTLTTGDGTKTVYVIYKSSDGSPSPVLSDTIELQTGIIVPPVVPPVPPIPPVVSPQPQPGEVGFGVPPMVVLFEFPNYQGRSESFTVDDPDLRNNFLGQDYASSIKVFGGATATLFQHINYQGHSEVFNYADPDLSDNFIGNNEVSSIKITLGEPVIIKPGDLIKNFEDTVYYYGSDGKRHTFPNRNTYNTWYNDFGLVKFMFGEQLANIPMGRNVTSKPGARMLKLTTDPKVYAVDLHGVLRPIASEEVASTLYGNFWATLIDDLPDTFFINYTLGLPINSASDFNPVLVVSQAIDIDTDLGLK